jgi:hypothetical protein
MKGKAKMIVQAIELKEKVHLGDILKGYVGNPGDFLVTTLNGKQGIIPKQIYQEFQNYGLAPRQVEPVDIKTAFFEPKQSQIAPGGETISTGTLIDTGR